jgi:hypothetical protein
LPGCVKKVLFRGDGEFFIGWRGLLILDIIYVLQDVDSFCLKDKVFMPRCYAAGDILFSLRFGVVHGVDLLINMTDFT